MTEPGSMLLFYDGYCGLKLKPVLPGLPSIIILEEFYCCCWLPFHFGLLGEYPRYIGCCYWLATPIPGGIMPPALLPPGPNGLPKVYKFCVFYYYYCFYC